MIETAQNITTMTALFGYANTVTSGWFSIWILISLFVVVLLSIAVRYGVQKGFVMAGFFCFITSLFLRTAGLISDFWQGLFILLLALGILWLWLRPE
jgi:hypothetical protein